MCVCVCVCVCVCLSVCVRVCLCVYRHWQVEQIEASGGRFFRGDFDDVVLLETAMHGSDVRATAQRAHARVWAVQDGTAG